MEWVETTGRTVDEAFDAALDLLGVDAADAEFEVLDEPKMGLFGRLRVEARVRARVRPAIPRPKEERRDRRRRGEASGGASATSAPAPDRVVKEKAEVVAASRSGDSEQEQPSTAPPSSTERDDVDEEEDELTLAEQGARAQEFVEGLLRVFEVQASTSTAVIDETTVEVAVSGDDLGLLIGPKGATLAAVQDLTRTVVQRHSVARTGRIVVDIAGYRQRRRAALERFTRQVADEVLQSGEAAALEPMTPADRKVVHDTANTIDGVTTSSEGEEPRRRVVIHPA